MLEESTLGNFEEIGKIFEDYFADLPPIPPIISKQTQLNILLRKWENKQRKTKKYKHEKFFHDGFLSERTKNTVLYIINNKRKFMKKVYNMQRYIMKNSIVDIGIDDVSYMFLNKTLSNIVNINEYSKKYTDFITNEINIIRPILIICCGNFEIVDKILHNKRKEELTKDIKYIPLLDMFPVDMPMSQKEYQLWFEYTYYQKFLKF